ncbi:MAG TPA: hypothetical protein VLX92_11965 [Kofleriaceae bacterium]|nr:hypothetical protein [Kofleriaceae bacterium]
MQPAAAVDASGIFLAISNVGVYALAFDGTLQQLAAEGDAVAAIATDATTIYWTTAGAIWTCPKAMAACTPTLFATGTSISGIVADGESVYWLDGGELFGCPAAGCETPRHVFTCDPAGDPLLPDATELVADPGNLYCTALIAGQPTAVRIPK